MTDKQKFMAVDAGIKILVVGALVLWVFIIYSLAVSGLPMVRQMLGCMLSTMAIFSLISFCVKALKNYRETLMKKVPESH